MNGTGGDDQAGVTDFSGIPTVILDSLRVRLAQLVHSLSGLQGAVSSPELLPWPALQQQFNVSLLQLESLVNNLESVPDATQRAVVYPMPNFPHKTHSGLLTTLLRKKNLPEVEEWIKQGEDVQSQESSSHEADDEFCEWAWETAEELTQIRVAPQQFKAPDPTGGWSLDKTIGFMAGQAQV